MWNGHVRRPGRVEWRRRMKMHDETGDSGDECVGGAIENCVHGNPIWMCMEGEIVSFTYFFSMKE